VARRLPQPVQQAEAETPGTRAEFQDLAGPAEVPADPDDLSGIPDDPALQADWIDERDVQTHRTLQRTMSRDPEKWKQFAEFERDPEVRDEFARAVRADHMRATQRPAAAKFAEDTKGMRPEGEKRSDVRTAADMAIYKAIADKVDLSGLTPRQRSQLADDVKYFVRHVHGAASRRTLPRSYLDLMGDQAGPIIDEVATILRKEPGAPLPRQNVGAEVARVQERRREPLSRLEQVVAGSLTDKWATSDAAPEVIRELTSRLQRAVESDTNWSELQPLLDDAFGANRNRVLEAFEAERQNVTREWEDLGEVQESDADAAPAEERGPYRDQRLQTPVSLADLPARLEAIRNDYDPKVVRFRAVPEVVETVDPETGETLERQTGRYTIVAEDRDASDVGFDAEERGRIREKSKKGGFENSVISVVMKDLEKPDRNVTLPVSIPNLVAETARTFNYQGRKNTQRYVRALVNEALVRLVNDPNMVRFAPGTEQAGRWNFPDDMKVAKVGGTWYTWGEVKRPTLTAAERIKQMVTTDAVIAARHAETIDQIREDILPLVEGTEAKDGDFASRLAQARDDINAEIARREREGDAPIFEMNREFGVVADPATQQALETSELAQRAAVEPDFEASVADVTARGTGRIREMDPAGVRTTEETTGLPTQGLPRPAGPGGTTGGPVTIYTRDPKTVRDMYGALAKVDRQGNVTVDMDAARAEHAAGFPYFLGKQDTPSSKQKAEVAKRLKLTQAKMKKLFPNAREFVRFLVLHERSHADHGDVAGYPRKADGTIDLMHPKALAIEERATRDALAAMARDTARESKLSEANLGTEPMSEQTRERLEAYLRYILGGDFEIIIKEADKAGTFSKVDGVEAIMVALRAADPMSVGAHEGMHALISRLRTANPKAASTLMAAAGSPQIVQRLQHLLRDEPAALRQLADPEERAAYMYQFWATGQLELGPRADGVFKSIRLMLRKVAQAIFGTGADPFLLERAELMLTDFHSGKYADRSTLARASDRWLSNREPPAWLAGIGRFGSQVFATAHGYVADMNIPAFTEAADKFFVPQDVPGKEPGLLQAKHVRRNQYRTRLHQAIGGLSESSRAAVLRALRGQATDLSADERQAVGQLRGLLDDIYNYMNRSGVKAVVWDEESKAYKEHDLRKVQNYVPRVYDREQVAARRDELVKLLMDNGYGEFRAKQFVKSMLHDDHSPSGETDYTAGLTPFAPETLRRAVELTDAQLEQFLVNDLARLLDTYIGHAVQRAEYTKRFGNQGQGIEQAVAQAVKEGATPEQVQDFTKAVRAMEGSLGNHIDPGLRGFFGGVVAYQNIRLLPLALFSSLVDPIGITVRSGEATQAIKAFARGIRELVSDRQDADRAFARLVGVITESHDQHMVAEMYGANYAGAWQQWLNRKLFQLNGMESWNQSMRVAAAAAARDFIIRHKLRPNEHSERYFAELNLDPDEVTITPDGGIELTPAVVDAVNRWVDSAVLRPHAGIRPMWMSDPRFMLVGHLKQFTYSFQKTITSRVITEVSHGNYRPVLALASYVPFMVASDMMRALVTPGGSDDERFERWTARDWLWNGVQRAGIMGPGEYAVSALDRGADMGAVVSLETLGGPTVQQMSQLLREAVGGGDMNSQVLRAIPPLPGLGIR